jgi:hypothetical protein
MPRPTMGLLEAHAAVLLSLELLECRASTANPPTAAARSPSVVIRRRSSSSARLGSLVCSWLLTGSGSVASTRLLAAASRGLASRPDTSGGRVRGSSRPCSSTTGESTEKDTDSTHALTYGVEVSDRRASDLPAHQNEQRQSAKRFNARLRSLLGGQPTTSSTSKSDFTMIDNLEYRSSCKRWNSSISFGHRTRECCTSI